MTPAGDSAVRAGAAWFQVKPRLAGGVVVGARMVRQGYVDVRGRYLIYPSLWPDAAGNAAMGFSESSSTMFPGTAFAKLSAGASNFGPVFISATGFGPYSRKSGRWGDYSFAVPGPGDTAWLANEYIPPKSSQTTDGVSNWGTRVVQVPLG